MGGFSAAVAVAVAIVMAFTPRACSQQEDRSLVRMTLVRSASISGAYCLDGSPPAYHFDRGFGAGASNWLLQFEGGGWCESVQACRERAPTRRGSTRYMGVFEYFSGILSSDASLNPDFYNWNRVKIRYCDGASFAGDAVYQDEETLLYFRGQRIWQAIISDLLPKGLAQAEKALLSGCSAGGLATFLHCDSFTEYLPKNATVKCLSDAGFFLDAKDIAQNYTMRNFFQGVVSLQGVEKNLHSNCTGTQRYLQQCFFPQYLLPYIKTPLFILNTAYDTFQFHHSLVPPSADPNGHWYHCKLNPEACNPVQINTLQGFRNYMLGTLTPFLLHSAGGGLFINSCFAHCQTESQETWYGPNSSKIRNKTIAEAVGDWYFGRRVSREIDCAYPCDTTCHNLL